MPQFLTRALGSCDPCTVTPSYSMLAAVLLAASKHFDIGIFGDASGDEHAVSSDNG